MDTVFHQNEGDSRLCAREARIAERSVALAMIFGGFPPVSPEQIGLHVAVRNEKVVAAAWIQKLTDELAAVWPPTSRNDPAAEAFLAKTLKPICDSSPYQLLRALIPSDATAHQTVSLETMGLKRITVIASFYYPVKGKHRAESYELCFHQIDVSPVGRGSAQFAHLTQITQGTFEDSQDCPGLTRATNAPSILNSYTAHPNFTPELWFRIAHPDDGQDVGVLILADNEEDEQLELVYLGITPAFRGLGYGTVAVAKAQSLAAERQRRRITLGVDVQNQPALNLYRNTGFIPYAEHELFMLTKS